MTLINRCTFCWLCCSMVLSGWACGSPRGAQTSTAANGAQALDSTPQGQLLAAIQSLRRQHRLQPLTLDGRLTGLASERTANSPPAAQQLAAGGVRSGLIFTSMAQGKTIEDIFRTLTSRAHDRAHLLNRQVSHVGIDVRPNRAGLQATLLLAHMVATLDVEQAPARLLTWINQSRHARGAVPLEPERNISAACDKAIRRFFSEPTLQQQDIVEDASAQLRYFSIAFRRIGGVMAIVSELADAAQLEPTFDPDLRYIGIGIAQGSRADVPANSIAVLIMFAWPR